MSKQVKERRDWKPGALSCPNKQEYLTDAFKVDVHHRASVKLDGLHPDDITLGKFGNSKIGAVGAKALTLVYSGLAGHDCPGSTPACRKTCYAMGFRYLDAAGKSKGLSYLYSYLAHNDISRLEDVIRREIASAQRRALRYRLPLAVRIHEAGDYVSVEHVAMWRRIASSYGDVTFWGYTRSDMASQDMSDAIASLAMLPNVNIRASYDPQADINQAPIVLKRGTLSGAIIVGSKHHGKLSGPMRVPGAINCPEQLTDDIGCADCGLCWHPSKPVIRFFKH